MQMEILNKLESKLTNLEIEVQKLLIEKRLYKDKTAMLEQQLQAAEALHKNTVEKINSVVTMIDNGVQNDR